MEDRHRAVEGVGRRLRRPGNRVDAVTGYVDPHSTARRAHAVGRRLGQAGQHLVHRERPGDPAGEVGQDLIGAGAPAVDEAVGEALQALPHGLEGHGHGRGSQEGQRQVGLATCAEQRADPRDDRDVRPGNEECQRPVDQRLVDDEIVLVEPVLEDRDAERADKDV